MKTALKFIIYNVHIKYWGYIGNHTAYVMYRQAVKGIVSRDSVSTETIDV
jgi:hypothetical protein